MEKNYNSIKKENLKCPQCLMEIPNINSKKKNRKLSIKRIML